MCSGLRVHDRTHARIWSSSSRQLVRMQRETFEFGTVSFSTFHIVYSICIINASVRLLTEVCTAHACTAYIHSRACTGISALSLLLSSLLLLHREHAAIHMYTCMQTRRRRSSGAFTKWYAVLCVTTAAIVAAETSTINDGRSPYMYEKRHNIVVCILLWMKYTTNGTVGSLYVGIFDVENGWCRTSQIQNR